MNRLRKTGVMIHKKQPTLKAEMIRAGVDVIELAALWGVAPSTVRQRLAGFSGMTADDIAKALTYCQDRVARGPCPPAQHARLPDAQDADQCRLPLDTAPPTPGHLGPAHSPRLLPPDEMRRRLLQAREKAEPHKAPLDREQAITADKHSPPFPSPALVTPATRPPQSSATASGATAPPVPTRRLRKMVAKFHPQGAVRVHFLVHEQYHAQAQSCIASLLSLRTTLDRAALRRALSQRGVPDPCISRVLSSLSVDADIWPLQQSHDE